MDLRVRLVTDAGVAEIEDEADAVEWALGPRLVAMLFGRGWAVADMWSWSGRVHFDLEGDRVRISGDDVPDVRVPALALGHALCAIGEAWADLLDRSGRVDEASAARSRLREAEAAMAGPVSPRTLPPVTGPALPAHLRTRRVDAESLVVSLEAVGAGLRLRLGDAVATGDAVEPRDALLDGLFLDGLTRLAGGGSLRYPLQAPYGYLRLAALGGVIRASGDGFPDLEVETGALLRTLHHAVDGLLRGRADPGPVIAHLRAHARARAALVRWAALDEPLPVRILAVDDGVALVHWFGRTLRCVSPGAVAGEVRWGRLSVVRTGAIERVTGGKMAIEPGSGAAVELRGYRGPGVGPIFRLAPPEPLWVDPRTEPERLAWLRPGIGFRLEGELRLVVAQRDPFLSDPEAIDAMVAQDAS